MTLTNLSDVVVEQDGTEPTSPHLILNYFKLILKILAVFILFAWTSTSNFLNSLNIDTVAMYPVTNLVKTNPYATMFNPGRINMSDEKEIKAKVGMAWWFELTQQTSYQVGGLILHYVFNFFKDKVNGIKAGEESGKNKSILFQFFSFLQWFIFAILTNALFALFLILVLFLWIPGVLGGLTAFMPLTYHTRSAFLKLCYKGFLLFWTFVLLCVAGWVTIFPVIYGFLHLLYLMFFKQLMDNQTGFVNEFMKRMKQLVYIYVSVAIILAFTTDDFSKATKTTIGVAWVAYVLYNKFIANKTI
jgi:hypothetical protein